jgi:tellurite resistance protein TehA-like permease
MFVVLFFTAAVALALWTHQRMPSAAPRDLRTAMLHIGGSLIACQLVAPGAGKVFASTGDSLMRLVGLVGVSLPALVYALLSVIWLISLLQGTLRNGMLR